MGSSNYPDNFKRRVDKMIYSPVYKTASGADSICSCSTLQNKHKKNGKTQKISQYLGISYLDRWG